MLQMRICQPLLREKSTEAPLHSQTALRPDAQAQCGMARNYIHQHSPQRSLDRIEKEPLERYQHIGGWSLHMRDKVPPTGTPGEGAHQTGIALCWRLAKGGHVGLIVWQRKAPLNQAHLPS